MRITRPVFLAIPVIPWLAVSAAMAQTAGSDVQQVSEGSIGLRGGFDSNPTDSLGAPGSPYSTQTIDYDYLRGSQQGGMELRLTAADTVYDPNVAAPSTSMIAAVTGAWLVAANLHLRTSLTTSLDDNWARRSHAEKLRNRFEYETTQYRIFANFDTNLNALNERDIFTEGDFLPSDENFATMSVMPGIASKFTGGEFGASVVFSRVAYLAPDILGLDRSHDTVQPNLFLSATVSGLEVSGSLSPFFANFDTADFGSVRQLLYTARVKYPMGPWTFTLGSSRTMQDTTLPFASFDEASMEEASVGYKFDDHDAVNLQARYARDDFLGVGLWSTTWLAGLDFAHDFGDGLTGVAAASVRRVERPGEIQPLAWNMQVGLQKKLDFGGKPQPAPAQTTGAKATATE
jgi:hypothetical protein